MAQSLFDVLAGVAAIDNQTALAVQSLLESQSTVISDANTTTTTACLDTVSSVTVDDEDVFQCGKCKKQFSSLASFMTHKREPCVPGVSTLIQSHHHPQSTSQEEMSPQAPSPTGSISNLATSIARTLTSTPHIQVSTSGGSTYGGISATSPLTHSVVLNDAELLSLTTNIENGTLMTGTSLPSSLFLPQVSPTGSSTLLTTIPTTQPIFVKADVSPCCITKRNPHNTIIAKSPSDGVDGKDEGDSRSKETTVNIITEFHSMMVKQRRRPGQVSEVKKATKLKCAYCEKSFSKNFDLQQHIRSHTGEKPFQCIVCGRAFAQKSNVKKHMQTHKVWPDGLAHTLPNQPLPQRLDDGSLSNEHRHMSQEAVLEASGLQVNTSLDDSGKLHILIDNSYICQYCHLSYKTYFELKTHLKSHKNEQVYKCILKNCGQTFLDLDSFLEHTKTHEHEMTYRCHLCIKNFNSLYELGVHQYTHSLYPNQGPRPGPRYYRCTQCMSKYASPEALDHHLATTTHSYQCPHCDKIFACERYLRRHLPTHGTIDMHMCGVCSKGFKTDHYLKMHMLIHSGEKPYLCNLCRAAFNRKDKLKRHLLIHEPVKRYKCPFRSHTGCAKEFNRPDKLKAHIITHSGLRPYKCKLCFKNFSRKPHLREHERIYHEDFRYHCQMCRKGFLREKQLGDHVCGSDKGERRRRSNSGGHYKGHSNRSRRRSMMVCDATKSSLKMARKRGRPRKKSTSGLLSAPESTGGLPPLPAQSNGAAEAAAVVIVSESDPLSAQAQALLEQQMEHHCVQLTNMEVHHHNHQHGHSNLLETHHVVELDGRGVSTQPINISIPSESQLMNLKVEPDQNSQHRQIIREVQNMVSLDVAQALRYDGTDDAQTVTVLGPDGVLHCSQVILAVTSANSD